MHARIVLLCLLVFVAIRNQLIANQAEIFREKLTKAEFVVIAVFPQRSHEFPIVLAAFGTPDKSDFKWLKYMSADITLPMLFAIPGQPVLHVRTTRGAQGGTEFTLPLYGQKLEMTAHSKESAISLPFQELPAFIQAFHNPLLRDSYVKKNWVKFVPEQKPVLSGGELKATLERRKTEWPEKDNEEKQERIEEERRNRPYFR